MEEVTVNYGGLDLDRLYKVLEENNIYLNDYARTILEHPGLTLTPQRSSAVCKVVSLADIGLAKGASLSDIFSRAYSYDLIPCTLEIALFFRISYRHLVDSSGLESQGKAPAEAITIASIPLESSDDFPKGLYIRRIDGVDWLRGYTCDDQYHFSPEDKFLFKRIDHSKKTG